MSLYKLSPLDPIYPSTEPDAMPIDSESLLDKRCMRNVRIEARPEATTMRIAPDNAAFKLSLYTPVVSFFALAVLPPRGALVPRLMVSLHTVVIDPDLPLVRLLDEVLNRAKILTLTPDRCRIEQKEGGSTCKNSNRN